MGSDDLFGRASTFRRFCACDGDEDKRLWQTVILSRRINGLSSALLSQRHLQRREDESMQMVALVAVWAEGFDRGDGPNGKAGESQTAEER